MNTTGKEVEPLNLDKPTEEGVPPQDLELDLDCDVDELTTPLVIKKSSIEKRRNSLSCAVNNAVLSKSEHKSNKSSFHVKLDDSDSVKYFSEVGKDSPRSVLSEEATKESDVLGQIKFRSDVRDDLPHIQISSVHKKSQFSNVKEEDESNFVLDLDPIHHESQENDSSGHPSSNNVLNLSGEKNKHHSLARLEKAGTEVEMPKVKLFEINTEDTEKIIRMNKAINRKRSMIKLYETLITRAKSICGQDPQQKSNFYILVTF